MSLSRSDPAATSEAQISADRLQKKPAYPLTVLRPFGILALAPTEQPKRISNEVRQHHLSFDTALSGVSNAARLPELSAPTALSR
jgi:hypothetical protein